jgi:hypothetical protein
VPGQQERDQLVAELVVGQPVLVLDRQELREYVAPLGEVCGGSTLGDLGVHHLIERSLVVDGRLPGPEPPQDGISPAQQHSGADVHGPVDQGTQPGEAVLVGHAEHDPEDHLERQSVHPVQRPEGRSGGPAADLLAGQSADDRLVAPQRGAVERRHQQLASALVLDGVLEQQRVLAHDGAEDRVGLAGVEDLRVAGEDLLGVFGPREQDQRRPLRHGSHREHVAVPLVHRGDEPVAEADQRDTLQERRPPRPRRELRRADMGASRAAGRHLREAVVGHGHGEASHPGEKGFFGSYERRDSVGRADGDTADRRSSYGWTRDTDSRSARSRTACSSVRAS